MVSRLFYAEIHRFFGKQYNGSGTLKEVRNLKEWHDGTAKNVTNNR